MSRSYYKERHIYIGVRASRVQFIGNICGIFYSIKYVFNIEHGPPIYWMLNVDVGYINDLLYLVTSSRKSDKHTNSHHHITITLSKTKITNVNFYYLKLSLSTSTGTGMPR